MRGAGQLSLVYRYTLEDVVGVVPRCDHVWSPLEGIAWSDRVVLWRCVHCRAIGARSPECFCDDDPRKVLVAMRCQFCCCAAWAVNRVGRDYLCSKHTRAKARVEHSRACPWRRHAAEIHGELVKRDRSRAESWGFVRVMEVR